MKKCLLTGFSILALAALATAHEEHNQHQTGHATADTAKAVHEEEAPNPAPTAEAITVKGEILDMACYLDHGAQGPGHADCAKTCIESGLPVGIKDETGKVYLIIGEHKPINPALAPHGGKIITVRGKAASRDGINLIENAEIIQ
ncbi:MAG: hypothetical protein HYW07_04155 [Candidatus Latescibacteria bacterium]|nr:hypothetical protein [Candidatus Latescibacterota bacterium]